MGSRTERKVFRNHLGADVMIIGVDTDRETYMELLEQNRKLRYNMLKWKAAAILKEGQYLTDNFGCDAQCERIVKDLEARAAKILEGK